MGATDLGRPIVVKTLILSLSLPPGKQVLWVADYNGKESR